ncbi:MAG: hypothetical protein Q8L98_01390 [Chlamydiales bacterium]|nr:hypothetical protein [Chlamydiales bacterium]
MGVSGIVSFAAIDTIKRSIFLLLAKAGIGTWPALLGYLLASGAYRSRDFLVTSMWVILCSSFFAAGNRGVATGMNELNTGVAELGGLLIGTFVVSKVCNLFNHIEDQRDIPGLSGILTLFAFLCVGSLRAETAPFIFNSAEFRLRSFGFASLFSMLIAAQALKGALPDTRNRYLAMYCACAFIGMTLQSLFDASELGKKTDVPSPFDLALD